MKTFDSIAQFDAFLDRQIASLERGFTATLSQVGAIIQEDARGRLGSYHSRVGPFPMWDELAESTKVNRLAKGYTDDEPLLRDGTLQKSISKEVTPWAVAVGVRHGLPSDRADATMGDIAMWQEFGAARLGKPHIPPRPFIGPALYATMEVTLPMAAAAVVSRLTGFPEDMFLGKHFSRTPIYTMSVATFALGQSQTGGK